MIILSGMSILFKRRETLNKKAAWTILRTELKKFTMKYLSLQLVQEVEL